MLVRLLSVCYFRVSVLSLYMMVYLAMMLIRC